MTTGTDLEPRPLSGHLWTIRGYLRDALRPPVVPASRVWTTQVEDEKVGEIALTGRLSENGEESLLVVVHGIAGCSESGYSRRAAAAAASAGLACLRLNLRGADRSGEDFYHAGLTADLHAALASRELAGFRSVSVLGYSLGGHVALRFATEACDPRVRAVAAVSSPLDLSACATSFDTVASSLYRRKILKELSGIFTRVAARRPVDVSPERLRRVRSLREFDGLTVVPRFGFADVEDYYGSMSVGPLLAGLRIPALLVVGVSDPLVPLETLLPYLEPPPARLAVRYLDPGGHVGFPSDASLGVEAPTGLENQSVSWLKERTLLVE